MNMRYNCEGRDGSTGHLEINVVVVTHLLIKLLNMEAVLGAMSIITSFISTQNVRLLV